MSTVSVSPAALIRRGLELISNLVAVIDPRGALSLRADMAEFICYMIHMLDGANHNNAAIDAVTQQLRERLATVQKLSLFPPSGYQLNKVELRELRNLSELNVNQCPPSTLLDLYELRSTLVTLNITNSGIVDIADVLTPAPKRLRAKLPPIILKASQINIPIKYCWTNLTRLTMSNCGIVRMDEAFHFFPYLTHLDLSHNDIMHVVHLHNCVNLESINLSYNRIRVLSNLERVIGRVNKMNLAHNDIESLDGLDKIYALEKINLSFNYIDDIAEVQHLCRLPNLESVYLYDNPIADLGKYRLRFFREFIVHGTVMNGNRPFPALDRQAITKREKKKLRKLMFRVPVDAMRESSYGIVDDNWINDDDDAVTVEENEEDEDADEDDFYPFEPTFSGKPPAINAAGRLSQSSVTRPSSMRLSTSGMDRTLSTNSRGGQSPMKARQSSVGHNFYRTVSSARTTSTATTFMAKRKFTKRIKRRAVILESDEPEVYPKLQEVMADIAAKKEQAQQLQRAQDAVEQALQLIAQSNASSPLPSSSVSEMKRNSSERSPTTSRDSFQRLDFPALASSPQQGLEVGFNRGPVDSITGLSQPPPGNAGVASHETSRHSLKQVEGSLLSNDQPIPFPSDIDPRLRGSEHILPAAIEYRRPTGTGGGHLEFMNRKLNDSTDSSQGLVSQDERDIMSNMDPYIGDAQYKDLNILDNLELYFREQVFSPKRPSFPNIYLHEDLARRECLPAGLQHALCLIAAHKPDERLVTMFTEKVIDLNNSPRALRKQRSASSSASVASADEVAEGEENETSPERAMAFVLSDYALYFIAMEEVSPKLTFADAPVFTVYAHHPLYQLSTCTIFFGFQRCVLTFTEPPLAPPPVSNPNTPTRNTQLAPHFPLSPPQSPKGGASASQKQSTAVTAVTSSANAAPGALIAKYMIITREKSRTYPIITRIPQVANQQRNHHLPNPLTNVKIENKDSQLIEQVMHNIRAQGDMDIVFYQMLFQTKSKQPGMLFPRSIVLTQSLIILCVEDLYSVDIQLTVLEYWKLKDIHKVQAEDNNMMQVTIHFKRTNVIGNRKKWRLCTDSRNASTKLMEECRRACIEQGNRDI